MTAPDIVYLHGFRSSPQSEKARFLRRYLNESGYTGQWYVPELPHTPEAVEEQITRVLERMDGRRVGLIGSSLGGFFAAVMAERYSLPAVLINPAPYPYDLMADYLGLQTNLYTGEVFSVTQAHLDHLRAMDPGELSHPERILVLLQTGDETLDYRLAQKRFQGAEQVVEEGGDHRYSSFETRLPQMLAFLDRHA